MMCILRVPNPNPNYFFKFGDLKTSSYLCETNKQMVCSSSGSEKSQGRLSFPIKDGGSNPSQTTKLAGLHHSL